MAIGRTVITNIAPNGTASLTAAQPPTLMTLEVACQIVGIARQTGRNALWQHKDRFECLPSPYMPNGARIVTPNDLQTLRELFPLRAKVLHDANVSRKK